MLPYISSMKTTIDIPEPLYKKVKIRAVERGRTLKQIVLISLERELEAPKTAQEAPTSYWANRKFLPEYEAAVKSGALSGGTDSTAMISEDRDSREDALR
jgi:hypothetical protein